MSHDLRGFIGALALAATLSLWQLCRKQPSPSTDTYIDDNESHATHCLMNATMAFMLTSFYTPTAMTIISILYWLAAAILCARILIKVTTRKSAVPVGRNPELGGSIYHLIAVAVMVYSIRLMPPAMTAGMDMPMAESGHGWLAWLIGILFLLDAIASSLLVLFFPRRLLDAQQRRISSLRLALFPHVLMDVGMVYMLLIV